MLFHWISGIYGWFFSYQKRRFEAILKEHSHELDVIVSACDVGCGTGALCSVLAERGIQTTGVDATKGMLRVARRKTHGQRIEFILANGVSGLPFLDKSFDLVFASHVAHGLKRPDRLRFYEELKRIAKKTVIIHDYNSRRHPVSTIIEWAEGGDYFNFIKEPKKEMEEIFSSISVVDVSPHFSWYICRCSTEPASGDTPSDTR